MNSERALHRYVAKEAKRVGVLCRKVVYVGRRGCPDILLVFGGRVMLLELKSPTGKGRLSASQETEIQRLRVRGMDVRVINSQEEVDDAIKDITHGTADTGR